MKNRKTLLIISLLLVVLVLAGCGGAGALVGKWYSEEANASAEFFSNGTCKLDDEDGKYAVKNGKLELTYDGTTVAIDYKVSGDKLTLTMNGTDIVFTKQK